MNDPTTTHDSPPVPFLKRVKIRNYKSIAHCDVELGALTLLVGRNESGKSNFLDALGFVADVFRTSLPNAVRTRGGFPGICFRGAAGGLMSIEIEAQSPSLPGGCSHFVYSFTLASRDSGRSAKVVEEKYKSLRNENYVHIEKSRIISSSLNLTDLEYHPIDRLMIPYRIISGSDTDLLYGLFTEFVSYDPYPEAMRPPRNPDGALMLHRDGSNIASVLARIAELAPEAKERLLGYLATITPGIVDVDRLQVGTWETLQFRQRCAGSEIPLEFDASSMSDGTLRALGTLVAVAQLADGGNPVRLVGIEEPETALHPAAAGELMDALQEAAVRTQVVVTTHSPDLLDQIDPETDRLLVAQMRDGVTEIGTIDHASREAIREHLFSPGELLRMDQLEPDWRDLERQRQARTSEFVGESG